MNGICLVLWEINFLFKIIFSYTYLNQSLDKNKKKKHLFGLVLVNNSFKIKIKIDCVDSLST